MKGFDLALSVVLVSSLQWMDRVIAFQPEDEDGSKKGRKDMLLVRPWVPVTRDQ